MRRVGDAADRSSGGFDELRQALRQGSACVVYGPPGIGKTFAVRRLLPDAIWVELGPGDIVDRLVVTVARHLAGTQAAIDALRDEDVPAALAALEEPINGRTLVIDRAERITTAPESSYADAAAALTARRNEHLLRWLDRRSRHHPTVVLCRGHRAPEKPWQNDWPAFAYAPADLMDLYAQSGLDPARRNEILDVTGRNPAAILLLSVSCRLAGGAIDEALESLNAQPQGTAAAWLASAWLPLILSEPLQTTLGVMSRLPGAPEDVVNAALRALEIPSGSVEVLQRLRLLETHEGGHWVLRTIEDQARSAYSLDPQERPALLAAAHRYLAQVGSRAQPTPTTARLVFEAHRLFVELGDVDEARRTAAFHVGGLIELAKRLSREKRYEDAAALYSKIDQTLNERIERHAPRGGDLDRLRSYVLHYKHFNRYMAELESAQDVLAGYREARRLWPENALWYAHEIGFLLNEGRERDALELRREAYERLPVHPRQDEILTGRVAESALKARRPFTALELLLTLGLSSRKQLALQPSWDLVLGGWRRGVVLDELPGDDRSLVRFAQPVRATLQEVGDEWFFEIADLGVFKRADAPDRAVRGAGEALAHEIRRLVGAYADELTPEELERKVKLLAYVDLLGGEIGLYFPSDRWLLGRIEGSSFIPVQQDFEPLSIPEGLRQPSEPDKLWLARVATLRDGRPTGEMLELKLAVDDQAAEE